MDNLPPELVLRICSYLEAGFVADILRIVNKRFHRILSDSEVWRARFHFKFPGQKQFPEALIEDDNFSWCGLCSCIEKEHTKWSNLLQKMCHFKLDNAHYASVDAIHLLPRSDLCITGSRDRSLCVWDLKQLTCANENQNLAIQPDAISQKAEISHLQTAHKGWIWCMTSSADEQTLYTGAWDHDVKAWQITNHKLTQISSWPSRSPVLAVLSELESPCVFVASYVGRVYGFDPRCTPAAISETHFHRGAVLDLAMCGDYLYSCGEDKKLVCVDRRMLRQSLNTAELPSFALALSCSCKQLWAASKNGNVHLFDPTRGSLDVIKANAASRSTRLPYLLLYQKSWLISGHKLNDVKHNLGCVIALFADRSAFFLNPYSVDAQRFAEIDGFASEPTKMDYKRGVLACGFSDCSVSIWKPKSLCVSA